MSKLLDSILGFIVGDALGVPVEFKERDSYHVTDMIAHPELDLPAGSWSDDSSMILATMQSIIEYKTLHWNDLMYKFQRWFEDGDFTPHGDCFDIGLTTKEALENYIEDTPALECGLDDEYSNGNGSLMRILPLAFYHHSAEDIANLSRLTHAHPRSIRACEIYLDIAQNLLQGGTFKSSLEQLEHELFPYHRLAHLQQVKRHEIKSSGYVVDTLEAALWCIIQSDNYRDCMLLAVNLGKDTDTIAAIAGGLAGIIYGRGGELGIPEEWIDTLARKNWILRLCQQFEQTSQQS